MSDSKSNLDSGSIDKEKLLVKYQTLLLTVWDCILPTLGRVSTMTIVKRAITLTQSQHPDIANLEVTSEGLKFERLREHLAQSETSSLLAAFQALISNLIDLLKTLTGDILMQQLLEIIENNNIEIY
jgi:hypothetical protein